MMMINNSVKVSVIMPCFNSSSYLKAAVDSILGQTYAEVELILIDDCSIDDTLEISRGFASRDGRVTVLRLPVRCGPATARNMGISVSKGEWVAMLDSDDVAMPARLEEQMRLALSDSRLVMIGSGSISVDAAGCFVKEHLYPVADRDLRRRLESMRAFPPHSSQMYKKGRLPIALNFAPRFLQSEDYDLWLRMSEVGRLGCIRQPLVKIRKHGQNVSIVEGGKLQIRYGVAAAVCHFLRVHGQPDPSSSPEDVTWLQFVRWIDDQLVARAVYKKHQTWAEGRAAFFASTNCLVGAVRFGRHLTQSEYAAKLIWEKGFGSTLAKSLARLWADYLEVGQKIG